MSPLLLMTSNPSVVYCGMMADRSYQGIRFIFVRYFIKKLALDSFFIFESLLMTFYWAAINDGRVKYDIIAYALAKNRR